RGRTVTGVQTCALPILVPTATPGVYVRPFPSLAPNSPILPNPADPTAPPNLLGNITETTSIGTSNYNALWVTANKRMTRGLQIRSEERRVGTECETESG